MSLKPATKEAMDLLLQGAVCMSRISQAGLRVDVPYLDLAIRQVGKQVVDMEKSLLDSREYKLWQKHFGVDMNLESTQQLGHVIFSVLGNKRNPFMGESNDIAAFEHLKDPWIKMYQDIRRMKKALVTNLMGIRKETIDGVVHPFFDLHTAESYRPSTSRPNFANIPVRNKKIAEIVRKCIIPHKDCDLLEVDYETHEVKVSYCYNKDARLRKDILQGDMHTDNTREVYMLSAQELGDVNKDAGKLTRYVGKNKFTFPEFYGSYYKQVAHDLWDAISLYDLKTAQGVGLFEHLNSKGVKKLGRCDPELDPEEGTFELHMQKVERRMWQERYPTYNQWKQDWWAGYQECGGVNTLTGFRQYGVFRRNQILCDSIQGSAFHCLLWTLIELQKQFIQKKMKSRVINQVYDSMLIDRHKDEKDYVVEMVYDTAVNQVSKHWPWIIIPLSVDFEVCEENWFKKKPLTRKAG